MVLLLLLLLSHTPVSIFPVVVLVLGTVWSFGMVESFESFVIVESVESGESVDDVEK